MRSIASQPSALPRALLRWLCLLGIIAVFTILLYPTLVVSPPTYGLGDIAEHDIKAPADFFVEDQPATQAGREQAAADVLTVYDQDPRILEQLNARVLGAFAAMVKAATPQAAVKTNAPTGSTANASSRPPTPLATKKPPGKAIETPNPSEKQIDALLWAEKKNFEDQIGLEVSKGAYRILVQNRFSADVAGHIAKILTAILKNGVVANKEVLLKEADKGIVLRNVVTQSEKAIKGLKRFYGPDQARTMVRVVGKSNLKGINYNQVNLIVDFCQRLLLPNITLNRNETEQRKKDAQAAIKPVLYQIKAGEMLLREGERITKVHLLKLQALVQQTGDKQISTVGLGAAMMLAILLILTYLLYLDPSRSFQIGHDKNLVFISIMLIAILLMIKVSGTFSQAIIPNAPLDVPSGSLVYGIPVASGAMIVCVFLGFHIAAAFAMAMALCAGVLLDNNLALFFYFLINSITAAYWARDCRERKQYIQAGAKIGLVNIIVATAVSVYSADHTGLKLIWDWAMGFSSGLATGIITVGVAPMVEMAFRYTTDISLMELANLDRPILKQLMLQAPGTYHHSVIVGSLVEAAADEIGANPLLAKVCGYYHDIGKMKKPLYFIENQGGGKNKHDKLAPSMSALILIAHIKDGVEIAKKNKLGQTIIDTIQQHHGTSLIRYFYDKARQRRGDDAVNIDDFRYPGPRPQTKEAGLVMLADVVEAASRTLDNPTPARIQGLVQNLINKVFSDGQLDNCELTLKDLHQIASSFNKILNGIHHHRIEYPDASARETGKKKNGHIDRQPAAASPDRRTDASEKEPGHLRRLGMS